MVEQHYLFNNITTMIFAVVIIAMFSLYCHLLVKQHKRPLGELLTWQAIKHNESIFVLMMIGACIAEGISAATVLAPGLIPSNPLARTAGHFFISFAGILGALTLFKDTAQIAVSGSDGWSRFFQALVVGFIIILTFGSPLLNLVLMAGNLKQEAELSMYLYSFKASPEDWTRALTAYGYDKNWSAWAALEPNLKVSVVITFLHFVIAGLEGARSMSTKERRAELMILTSPKSEKDDKKDDKKEDKKEDKPAPGKPNLRKLLEYYGYTGADLDSKLEASYKILADMPDKGKQGKLGVRAVKLVDEISTIKDTKYPSDAARKDAENALKEKIKEFFGNSHKIDDANKAGLSTTLKAIK